MLRSVRKLEGLPIGATDGTIGKVKDFYFDDEAWVIRYLVVDTSQWLGGREVLISPYAIGQMDRAADALPVTATREQVKNSPSIDSDKPISRQYEKSYLGYYGYPYYWGGTGLWGEGNYPGTLLTGTGANPYGNYQGYLRAPSKRDTASDPHLRSCESVKGYHIRAKDGEIGHVQGYLVDDGTWSIRYLIVNTSNWWMGHQILLSPEWIQEVSWSESVVSIDLDRQAIKDAPAYDDDAPLERNSEGSLYSHYGRHGYWHEQRDRAVA
jgi:sporulation protein YlmC with PRC-barrel domain